jgi:colanic acid/amylovoran biosynthesis glycosyltransferase
MLGYLFDRFPVASETFIAREVEGLARLGIKPKLWALREGDLIAGTELLVNDLRVLPGILSPRSQLAELAAILSHPVRYVDTTLSLIRGCFRSPRTFLAELMRGDAAFALARQLRSEGVTHLHAHFGFVASTVAYAVWKMTRIPFSVSVHAWDIFVNRSMIPEKLSAAAMVMTCTDYAREYLLKTYKRLDPARVVCVHHGLDLTLNAATPARDGAATEVLAVGRMTPKKGFSVLLRAMAIAHHQLSREGRSMRLTLVGDGPRRKPLARLADALGLGDSLHMTGALPQADVREAIRRSHMMAVPSVMGPKGDRDGLPNVVLEAMAAGRAVVASDFSGIPEAVEDGRTGILVRSGDHEDLARALVRLARDRATATRMGLAGREVVESRFSLQRSASRLAEAFATMGAPS